MGEPHSNADAEYSDGRYRLRCACGWTSTWHADAASAGAAYDEHLGR